MYKIKQFIFSFLAIFLAIFPSYVLAGSTFCPTDLPLPGPSFGEDVTSNVKTYYSQETSDETGSSDETLVESDANANKIAVEANSHVGEDWASSGENRTPYNKSAPGSYWCAYFATSVLRAAGYDIPKIGNSKATLKWFASHGHSTFTDPAQAAPGDIVVWTKEGNSGHIGIVVANNTADKKLSIVEGNVEGDKVKRYVRTYENVKSHMNGLVGFGRW